MRCPRGGRRRRSQALVTPIAIFRKQGSTAPYTQTRGQGELCFSQSFTYFMGNCIKLSSFIVRMAAKSPFCWHSILPHKCIGSRWNPVIIKPLSAKISFVKIDPGVWKLPQDKQRVSSLLFETSPIIIVVG